MPEFFDPEHREDVEFDLFDSSHDKSQFFKKSLEHFKDVHNHFFYAVIYGIMHHRNITLENAENVLGPKFFIELKKKKLECLIIQFLDFLIGIEK